LKPKKAIEFEMPFAGIDGKWRNRSEQTYFVKLESGGYVRMRFQMIADGGHFAVVESYYNSSGSRNLEYDSANAIKPNPLVVKLLLGLSKCDRCALGGRLAEVTRPGKDGGSAP
jgi:hypothetical protein